MCEEIRISKRSRFSSAGEGKPGKECRSDTARFGEERGEADGKVFAELVGLQSCLLEGKMPGGAMLNKNEKIVHKANRL